MSKSLEGEAESSQPRERPTFLRTATMTPASKRASGEGAPVRVLAVAPARVQDHSEDRQVRVGRLLRHKLTSPEKRTVKRIQAQRVEHFLDSTRPGLELVKARVLGLLREDRGLQAGIDKPEAYQQLTGWLVDEAMSERTAAEVIGLFLREVGAMERPALSAPRVKAALRLLNEQLYGSDLSAAIPQGIREFRLEKRDGGLQIVGVLRAGAVETSVLRACTKVCGEGIDIRLIARK